MQPAASAPAPTSPAPEGPSSGFTRTRQCTSPSRRRWERSAAESSSRCSVDDPAIMKAWSRRRTLRRSVANRGSLLMYDESLAFLRRLLETPSPSGYERDIQNVVRDWARPLADEVKTDRHGNVLAIRNPEGHPRIMLAGHCDQIALMVQHIDDNGFLYVQPMGGWDMQILLGQYLTVWARSGPITGVISRKAPHLLTNDERNKVPQFQDVWVDIGAKNRDEAEQVVRPGDVATFALGMRELRNGLAAAPGMDDKGAV